MLELIFLRNQCNENIEFKKRICNMAENFYKHTNGAACVCIHLYFFHSLFCFHLLIRKNEVNKEPATKQ
jgi:hypothetical protein